MTMMKYYIETEIVNSKKMWIRYCPDCRRKLYHTNRNNARYKILHGALCKPCSKLGTRNSFYGKKHSEKTKRLYSRRNSGSGNPMYGTNGGHFGHHHSESAKRKIAERHILWWKARGANPTEFEKYRNRVDSITRTQPLHLLENIDKRGKAGIDGAYHLDHIKSVFSGFKNSVSPEVIGHISNLQMLPWKDNQRKWLYDEY